jgi:hypothetical protein
MQKRNNNKKQETKEVVFRVITPRPSVRKIHSYSDVGGNVKNFVIKRELDGREKTKSIEIPAEQRYFKVNSGLKDINKDSWLNYILESPHCKGSAANKFYKVTPIFEQYNPQEEAKARNQKTDGKLKALFAANSLTGDSLRDMAVKMLDSDEAHIRATFEKAISLGVVGFWGFQWKYKPDKEQDGIVITTSKDKDDMIQAAVKNPGLVEAVFDLVEKESKEKVAIT